MTQSYFSPHVVAGDPQTAQAGQKMLALGGNSVDAAIAATMAAFVAEPVLTGPLGGGFALVCGPKLQPTAYDFFATTPARIKNAEADFTGIEVSFGPTKQTFHVGRAACALPGLLPGLLQLHAQHGSLPLTEIVQPAVALAQQGAVLSVAVQNIANILTPILNTTPLAQNLFSPSQLQQKFYNPILAKALQRIGGGEWHFLYESLATVCGEPHGLLSDSDMATIAVWQKEPLHTKLGSHTVLTTPPPSLAGMLIASGLRLCSELPTSTWQHETSCYEALLAALARCQQIRQQHVDPAVAEGLDALERCVSVLGMPFVLQPFGLQDWLANATDGQATSASKSLGSTTHISCMDKQGMACAITSSNGEGCGHVVPAANVMANNFLGEADINPLGFFAQPPHTRMVSMMCPTLIVRSDGKVAAALGSGGSNRIRTAILQVLVHHLLGGLTLKQAILKPRLHYEGEQLFVEAQVFGQRLSPQTLACLERRVPNPVYFHEPNMFFGGVHAASMEGGIGDPRRCGAVAMVD